VFFVAVLLGLAMQMFVNLPLTLKLIAASRRGGTCAR